MLRLVDLVGTAPVAFGVECGFSGVTSVCWGCFAFVVGGFGGLNAGLLLLGYSGYIGVLVVSGLGFGVVVCWALVSCRSLGSIWFVDLGLGGVAFGFARASVCVLVC